MAAPWSSPATGHARFSSRDRLGGDDHSRQYGRAARDANDDKTAVAAQFHSRTGRRDHLRGGQPCIVTARGQACGFACRIDASDLDDHRREPGGTEQEHDDQTGDRQGGLHRAEARIARQTLVVNARLMMFVNAPTIESPVTTL